ncbi:MAG: amidohydrolase family protein [Candidatus Cloacimonetes bacterium]|nr:amidohydrolase family protein [Candidatus Cloacimonadota bacterium]MDD4156051.1 amidohydrolase family protein [Candidatus Cloacimonadota bacterium]
MLKIKVNNSVSDLRNSSSKYIDVEVNCKKSDTVIDFDYKNKFAYKPFINSHDHLISNWFPRSGNHLPYTNSHIWVEENKNSESFLERNKIWENNGDFDLLNENAKLIVKMGMYKNIFSGVHILQDHIKQQKPEYYKMFDIYVIEQFTQCHSIILGNWWGGSTAEEEMKHSKGIIPFIIHLSEGIDNVSKSEFNILLEKDLLRMNTLIIHGICLTKDELSKISEVGASVCWCPSSNMYLIGQTLDVLSALEKGVNICLGTDSTMTGGIHLFDEFKHAKRACNKITGQVLYQMVTKNAEKALFLNDQSILHNQNNLLILEQMHDDIYENLLYQEIDNIDLLIHQSKPIYGNLAYFELFNLNSNDYEIFKIGNKEKFIIGHPQLLNSQIDEILGYHKNFPFLPF